jgi:ATP-dependent Clp protease ATP-binding subunit ClpA
MLQITIKYPIIQQLLTSNANHSLYIALADKQAARLNTSAMMFAGQFANKFQAHYLDKGEYKELIPFFETSGYEARQISVNFRANKNTAYKSLDLEFLYLVHKTERGYSLVVPVLNISAFAAEESEIEESVTEVIRMDFIRNKRLDFLQNALSTLWFHDTIVKEEELTLNTYTLSELERLETDNTKKILPSVAQVLAFGTRAKDKMLFGYEAYLQQIADALKSQYNRSILLVGKTGVGKTTLVWEAVRQHKTLGITQTVWETTASTLIKELTQQTGWQQGLTVLCQELRTQGDVLFVRNLVELFEVGQYEGNSVSMGLFMREFIARGEITLVSECSDEELAHIEMRQPNFSNLFNIIRVEEPKDDLQHIIQQKIQTIAENKGVQIDLEAIQETVRLQRRYTPYAGFPGKPIRFLESILVNTRHLSLVGLAAAQLDKAAVIRAFCDETGMPEFMVNPEVPMRLASVEDFFLRNVFGQNHAVHILLDMLAAVKTSLLRQGKPIASMLFVGPTGVGKTEMAKVLAEFMFGSRDKMIRFDMSEFSDHTAVGRLIGEHYFADGLLTSAVRREPFCVLLFDELEKASGDFNDLLLQMLGEGRLSDSQGKIVNFCSTIIIMTSNIGAKKLQMNNIGWDSSISDAEIADFFENEVRKFFRPEISNRIDQIIPFYALNIDTIKKVVAREIAMLAQREGIFGRKLDWKCGDDVLDYLAQIGHHPKYGARALQRALREELIIPLAQLLNQYPFDEKIVLHISMQDGALSLDVDTDPLKIDLMLEELTHHEFTDYASDLRQRIYRLLDGNTYARFLSELKDLESKQKKQAKDFWNNAREPRKLSYFISIKERINKAVENIDAMETDMAMISMNLRPLNTLLYDKIKAWELDYNNIKLELLGLLYPQYNITLMGIYGKNPQAFLQFYIDLCERKGFSWEAKTVWFRESLYNEEINPEEDDNDEFDFKFDNLKLDLDLESDSNYYVVNEQDGDEKPEKVKRKAYFKKDYDTEESESYNFKPDQKDDLLVGVELLIMAHGIKLYFEEENGVHRYSTGSSDKNFVSCLIQMMDISEKTQENLHRKFNQFNITRPRRTIFDQSISDILLKLNKVRALKNNDKDEQLALIKRYLDSAFSRRLEEELNN